MPLASENEPSKAARLLDALQQLLAIDAEAEFGPALDLASSLIGHALDADMVDVFFHDGATDSLVAVGSPTAELSRQQRAAGLDRLALGDGGLAIRVFQTGQGYRTGSLDREPDERQDLIQVLEILSAVICRISWDGTPRGVLQAGSTQRDWFTAADLRFLEAASAWVGLFARHAGHVEQVTQAALEERQGRALEERARLTAREQDVAILVASGLTNDEIADRLVLVRGTVANHIVHILRKLGFTRRVQIATWTVQHALWTPGAEQLLC